MSLITDKVFYNALLSNNELVDMVSGRIENTSIPVPDDELLNEPVPYIIITYDGMQNDGFTKDNSYEGDTDYVQVSIEVAAEDRETLGNIMETIRNTVVRYFEDGGDVLTPNSYTLTAGQVSYDPDKPCYSQTLQYNCDTNP